MRRDQSAWARDAVVGVIGVTQGESPRRTQGIRPPERLTSDQVVATASRIVDREGVPALTVRRLATEIGVTTNAITWHVGDRAELLARIGAHWLGMIDPPPVGDDPIRWLGDLAHTYRAAAHLHPHLARLAVAGLAAVTVTGDTVMPEAVVAALLDAGAPARELADLYNIVLAAVVGFVDLELASGGDAALPAAVDRLDAGAAPAIAEHIGDLRDRSFALAPTAARFDSSFALLIEIVLARLRTTQRVPTASRGRPARSS